MLEAEPCCGAAHDASVEAAVGEAGAVTEAVVGEADAHAHC